jgi:hypothetical protein
MPLCYRASLSACVRLVYTVNLTNANDYLHGVSDVVLWGYAENGVGLIVGCVATLRPLFSKILRLGGDSSVHHTPAASYAKRPIVKSHLAGRDEEWVALSDKKMTSSVQGKGSEDEEYILPPVGSGIKVTSTVEQSVGRAE